MALLTISNVVSALIVLYIALTLQQLYSLVNPLNGIDIPSSGLEPLWKEKQKYSILCFLSQHRNLKTIDLSTLDSRGQIIFERTGLSHEIDQAELSLSLSIKSSHAPSSSNGTLVADQIFHILHKNSSSVYLHALVFKERSKPEIVTEKMMQEGQVLHSSVKMIKYDVIPKSFRYRYLLSDFGLAELTPDEAKRAVMPPTSVISYWKPEVSVRLVADFAKYPYDMVPEAVSRNIIRSQSRKNSQQQPYYKPALYSDEIGLTSDQYIHLNDSVTELPLKISIGPMSTQRWFLMSHLEESLSAQKGFGFSDKDIDDVRRMITDTSLTFLLVTIIASMLHLLFEFLAFQSDISFWSHNKSLAGLSTRTVITDLISQVIVFLFLLDSDTSLLVLIPSLAAILIQMWKVQKATGLTITFTRGIEFQRWKPLTISQQTPITNALAHDQKKDNCNNNNDDIQSSKEDDSFEADEQLAKVSFNADRVATISDNGQELEKYNESTHDQQDTPSTAQEKPVCLQNDRIANISDDGQANDDSKDSIQLTIDIQQSDFSAAEDHLAKVLLEADQVAIISDNGENEKDNDNSQQKITFSAPEEQLAKVSLEADRVATIYLGSALLPIVLIFILRSLVYEKHASWYSWAIGSLTGSVYAFGFVFMCPQLYINHQLKSVSHLPWQYLIYKFLNTFVDDLFAFIIKMPVMHRLSVFRDDIVFLVYLYQRWIYRVDKDRPIEK